MHRFSAIFYLWLPRDVQRNFKRKSFATKFCEICWNRCGIAAWSPSKRGAYQWRAFLGAYDLTWSCEQVKFLMDFQVIFKSVVRVLYVQGEWDAVPNGFAHGASSFHFMKHIRTSTCMFLRFYKFCNWASNLWLCRQFTQFILEVACFIISTYKQKSTHHLTWILDNLKHLEQPSSLNVLQPYD